MTVAPSGRFRQGLAAGARIVTPLAVPVVPVGFVLGVGVNETDAVSRLAGVASGPLVLGGASQLAAVSLLGTGAGVITTALTIAMINARHVMYSARLRSSFASLPRWFRIVAPYFLLDQVFAMTELRAGRGDDDRFRMGHYLGCGLVMAGAWWVAVVIGVYGGQQVPDDWDLDFAVPLLFLGLLILAVADRPGVLAAISGGVVAVAGRSLPSGGGLLAGAVAGVIVGGLSERWLGSDPAPAEATDHEAPSP